MGMYINLSAIVLSPRSLQKFINFSIAETPSKYFGKYGLKLLSKRDRGRKEKGRENRKKDGDIEREEGRIIFIFSSRGI